MNLGLLFTYGVTSAGKTYTVTGTPARPGILPQTLDVLFNTLETSGSSCDSLQTMKNSFKSDNQNGFEFNCVSSLPPPETMSVRSGSSRSSPNSPIRQGSMLISSTPSRPVATATKQLELLQKEWAIRQRDFELKANQINQNHRYAVFVSFVEIYNNYIYDLFDDNGSIRSTSGQKNSRVNNNNNSPRPSKGLREDKKKRVYVQGVVELEVKSADEAFDIFLKGVQRRRIGSTVLNAESSRSHSVFTIRVVQAPAMAPMTQELDSNGNIHVSQLSIVDLAGCERAGRTNAVGSRLKEAGNINNSLMTLRKCFDVLRENQKSLITNGNNANNQQQKVPYRDSKLTHLFRSYFEGEGAVKMVLCLNPGADDFEETLNVLKFGEQSQEIVTSKGHGPQLRLPQLAHFGQSSRVCLNFDLKEIVDLCAPVAYFGPSYPKRTFDDYLDGDKDNLIPEFITTAKNRKDETEKTVQQYLDRNGVLREMFCQLEQEEAHLQLTNNTLRGDLSIRDAQLQELNGLLAHRQAGLQSLKSREHSLLLSNNDLLVRNQQQDAINGQLQHELDHFNNCIASYLENEKNRLKQWCRETLKRKQQELERMKCVNEEKMHLVNQILGADNELDLMLQCNLLSPMASKPDVVLQSKTTAEAFLVGDIEKGLVNRKRMTFEPSFGAATRLDYN